MDTSKEYIAMCDCPEIQDVWKEPPVSMLPSYVWDHEINKVCIMVWLPNTLREKIGTDSNNIQISTEWANDLGVYNPANEWEKTTLWLPRQDQLQEMVYKDKGLQTICTVIEQFSKSEYGCKFTINGTMEQLWLAFVMKELHGKVWEDGKWK